MDDIKEIVDHTAILVARVKTGDEAAFAILFKRFYPETVHYTQRYLKDRQLSEEVAQRVFINLWKYRDKLDDTRPLEGLLFTISRRLTLNELRRIAGTRKAKATLWRSLQKTHNDTEQYLSEKNLSNFVVQALAQLSHQQRQVFQLSRYEGLSHEEIAQQLCISKSTVNNHLVQAIRKLRNILKQHDLLFALAFFMFF